MNLELFKLINDLAYKSQLMDNLMIKVSTLLPIFFMVSIAAVYIYGFINKNPKMRSIAVNTVILTAINLFIAFVIGLVYYVPRPFVANKVNLLYPHANNASFPSDHSIGTMSISLGIYKYKKAYGVIFIMLSCIVGFSRMYVGHHYPLDVICGYLLVFITNFLYGKIIKDKIDKLYFAIESKIIKS